MDFSAKPAVAFIHRYPNLLIMHTTSKPRSLADMRTGFMSGHMALIEALGRVKDGFDSYPLDRLARAVVQAAREDGVYFCTTYARVVASRARLTQVLWALGFEVVSSMVDLIFVRHPTHDVATLAARLKGQAILVRHLKLVHIDQHLRTTAGTDDECDAFLNVLWGLLK